MAYLGYDLMGTTACLMAGKQAGVIGILTALAKKIDILAVVAYDEFVKIVARELCIPVFATVYDKKFIKYLTYCDLLISIHGREVIPRELLSLPKIGCINLHPCLYRYKGKNPIERLLRDGETKASVGSHWMTEKVDTGHTISEEFVNIKGLKTVTEVYNTLYPYYSFVLLKTLDIVAK
jgi:methionyl-tRNA formyltransferase